MYSDSRSEDLNQNRLNKLKSKFKAAAKVKMLLELVRRKMKSMNLIKAKMKIANEIEEQLSNVNESEEN